jgi:hypothetical protein
MSSCSSGGLYNFITLSWEPAIDSVGVVGYQVYGSQDPSVPVNSSTLLGQTPEPGFQHNGLGFNQQWHYRVIAVDGASLEVCSSVVQQRAAPENDPQ